MNKYNNKKSDEIVLKATFLFFLQYSSGPVERFTVPVCQRHGKTGFLVSVCAQSGMINNLLWIFLIDRMNYPNGVNKIKIKNLHRIMLNPRSFSNKVYNIIMIARV